MMDELLKYGFPGICLVAVGIYLARKDKDHRKERDKWYEVTDKHFDRLNEMNDETNKVLRENTNILTGLKTLLENRR